MLNPDTLQLLKEYVANANSILVIFSPQVSYDQAASSAALFLALQSLQKNVSLLSPTRPGEKLQNLAGMDQVTEQLGNKNLDIMFEYQPDMVDKVSYNIDEENQKFHLIVTPKKGQRPLDTSTVQFLYTGADADLIFLIGVPSLESLDGLYYGFEDLYSATATVSLNTYETDFGTVKIDTSGNASMSEMIAQVLPELGVQIDADMATDLLSGIESATESFRSLSTTADTFEMASQMLRAGARRMRVSSGSLSSGLQPAALQGSGQVSASNNGFAAAMAGKGAVSDKPKSEKNSKIKKPQNLPLSEAMGQEGGSRV